MSNEINHQERNERHIHPSISPKSFKIFQFTFQIKRLQLENNINTTRIHFHVVDIVWFSSVSLLVFIPNIPYVYITSYVYTFVHICKISLQFLLVSTSPSHPTVRSTLLVPVAFRGFKGTRHILTNLSDIITLDVGSSSL